MDEGAIFNLINEAAFHMDNSSCDQLMRYLNLLEYVVIEDKKKDIFKERIKYICLANSFDVAMRRDYRCKQIKRFFKKFAGFDEERAKYTANKLNEARRVFPRLDKIVRNCCSCPNVDIRNLSIHELYLANSLSWVLKRNAENKAPAQVPDDAAIALDAGSVEATKQAIINSTWYQQACRNPKLVSNILSGINTFVVNDSIYKSKQ